MKLVKILTLRVPVGFFQLVTCKWNQSPVSNAALCQWEVRVRPGWGGTADHLWTACRSTRAVCRRAAAWWRWSGRCTRHSPSGHPPRSYPLWRTSPPAPTHQARLWRFTAAQWPWITLSTSVYLRENHQTTPRRRDIQGLFYSNPPRTSGPLFWKGAKGKPNATL